MNKKIVLARAITNENFMKDVDLYINQVCNTYGIDNTLTLDDSIDFVDIIVDMIVLLLKCKDEKEVKENKPKICGKKDEATKLTNEEKSHFNSIFKFIINTYKIDNDSIMECLNIKSNMLTRYKNNTAYISEEMLNKLIVKFNVKLDEQEKNRC